MEQTMPHLISIGLFILFDASIDIAGFILFEASIDIAGFILFDASIDIAGFILFKASIDIAGLTLLTDMSMQLFMTIYYLSLLQWAQSLLRYGYYQQNVCLVCLRSTSGNKSLTHIWQNL